ncbi:MAG: M28 family metallopeptidase [Candidatus Bathyarchaeia archaeon]
MYRKVVSVVLAYTLLSLAFNVTLRPALSQGGLTSQESQIVALVNGTSAYNYALKLEEIALNHSVSKYSFRVGGSVGASETAKWIEAQFKSFGLEAYMESFEFTNWTLLSQPELVIDYDGNVLTGDNQILIKSFQSAHYSWPTSQSGVFADLVVLPLPEAANHNEVGTRPINTALWNAVNTAGKILLVGKEVRWSSSWEQTFKSKLTAQPPAAVIYTWWYDWMNFTPPMFSSGGGRPMSSLGAYYWNLTIPVGWVNYEDGLLIRNKEDDLNVSARVSINSVIGFGSHYNVIGRLQGSVDPEKLIIVSGHYDTVMTSGFCDNAAGTAGVIELARIFSEAVEKGLYAPKYTVLFVAFASEELWLVGSVNYVRQHKAQMEDIIAVVNVDSIGSDELAISETPGDNLDIDGLVWEAARDLNVSARLISPGSSDQEAFRDPARSNLFYMLWGLDANISDAVPVRSSTMISSSPILYSDKWFLGKPGWLHTSYDNSTSTQTLSWVEPDDLQDQIRVAALSVMRVSSPAPSAPSEPFSWLTQTTTVVFTVVAAVVLVVVIVYLAKVRKPPPSQFEEVPVQEGAVF